MSTDQQLWDERDAAAMRRALDLATLGPAADPNPRVGAVVVDQDGTVVGTGFHAGASTPHAEVLALQSAGERARGATLFVTLEPCSHDGRTGPCTAAVIDSGVARVVFAQADPNPEAAGGAHALRAAGLDVEGGRLAAEAERLNRAWTYSVRHGRPFVTWKVATTLDGRCAAADGSSRWVTGPAARADVHDLRAECGAVLVGTGTAVRDDPQLTARHTDGSLRPRQPLRVVLGERGLPPGARVLDDAAPTLVLAHRDPQLAVKTLADREIRHVLLEGGPTVAAAFLRAGLVNEVVAYLAPALLGSSGLPALGDLGLESVGQAVRLDPVDVRVVGTDVRVRADVVGGA